MNFSSTTEPKVDSKESLVISLHMLVELKHLRVMLVVQP